MDLSAQRRAFTLLCKAESVIVRFGTTRLDTVTRQIFSSGILRTTSIIVLADLLTVFLLEHHLSCLLACGPYFWARFYKPWNKLLLLALKCLTRRWYHVSQVWALCLYTYVKSEIMFLFVMPPRDCMKLCIWKGKNSICHYQISCSVQSAVTCNYLNRTKHIYATVTTAYLRPSVLQWTVQTPLAYFCLVWSCSV